MMHVDPTTATAFIATIVVIVTAGIAAYMHLLPMIQGAITATQTMLQDIGALKTTAAVHTTQIDQHDQAINGVMDARIQAVVDRHAVQSTQVVPVVAVSPTPIVPGGRRVTDPAAAPVLTPAANALQARITALQVELEAAKRLTGATGAAS